MHLSVDQLLVDLVGERVEVVVTADIGDEPERIPIEHRAGGVRGGVDHDQLRPGADGLEEGVVDLEGFGGERVVPGDGACELHAGLVGDPRRIEDERLVARVQHGLHRLVDGVFRPAGDDHLALLRGKAVLAGDLLRDRGRQRGYPGARGVMRLAAAEGVDAGVLDMLRGIEIRLPDGEADDIDALLRHPLCGVRDLDRRGRSDGRNLLREAPHPNRWTIFTADSTARFA